MSAAGGDGPAASLRRLDEALAGESGAAVEGWNPPFSGVMDLRINVAGEWLHEGSPIRRAALVRLFARVLRCEADGHHYLVTPVEKWRIEVDDAPFLGVAVTVEQPGTAAQRIVVTTNLDETVTLGPRHPLQVEYAGPAAPPRPYLALARGLRALLTRAAFVELAGAAEPGECAGVPCYGVRSAGRFFFLGPLEPD